MKYVVIGGDAAGMSAASRLKRVKPEEEVIVFEKTEDVSYSACGMPYNIADEKNPMQKLVVRNAETFRTKQNIDLRTGHKATGIDKNKKIVFGEKSDGSTFKEQYDKLLIATGASAIIPEIHGINNEAVFVLKTLNDGKKIKNFIENKKPQTALIIGMGYIALEMAEALSTRGIKVTMIKKRQQLLPWMLPELSNIVGKELADNKIEFFPGQPLKAITKEESSLIIKTDKDNFKADMVLIAIGVKPSSELADSCGIKLGKNEAISIDSNMKTSVADIFAAGDCADCMNIVSGQKTWTPLALTANRGGRIAADNMLEEKSSFPGITNTSVFKAFNLEIAKTGLTLDEAERAGFTPVYKVIESKSKAHVYKDAAPIHLSFIADKKTGRILGSQIVGTEGAARRINSAAVALKAEMTLEDFYNCDLAYAPPFSPVWDPLLTAASILMKQID
ncbi:MAG: FAD-dependent oxidoreductase [Spirochaetales bacterium]|nr:FAD-dependent oxidoreductase [Spirochaetales bacterium]